MQERVLLSNLIAHAHYIKGYRVVVTKHYAFALSHGAV